jgi:Aerotolerance regulator N-terminal
VIFERPWWLAGLILVIPLTVLHLRRPAFSVREVASVLIWDRFTRPSDAPRHRLSWPRHAVLLLLQAIAFSALVGALAGPRLDAGVPPPRTVFVVDDSLWIQVDGRLAAARRAVLRAAGGDEHTRVAVVEPGAPPSVSYVGTRAGLSQSLSRLAAGRRPGALGAALGVASGLVGGPRGRIVVVRPPEDPLPQLVVPAGRVTDVVLGAQADDQGIFDASARCGIGPDSVCEVLATIRNGSGRNRVDRYSARAGSGHPLQLRLTVPAHASRSFVLTTPPATTVVLRLAGHDELASDDSAVVAVPGFADVPSATTVTLVGDPSAARSLARALVSVPGVTLKLRTPENYRAQDATGSGLVVLDGWVPPSGLPPAPAVLLVHPPRLPGGAVIASMAVSSVTGVANGNELVDDVDLSSLSIDRGAAEQVVSPSWLAPVVWADSGPLLAAGDDGRQRLALLAFDVGRSNLAQLPALPILLRNVVRWSSGWGAVDNAGSLRVDAVPDATQVAVAGRRIALHGKAVGVDDVRPGRVQFVASGPGFSYSRELVSGLSSPSSDAVGQLDLTAAMNATVLGRRRSLATWLIVLAIAAMLGEWAVWRRLRR